MDRHELDQAVNRQLEEAYWPWWFAVAYVQPKPERYEAMRLGLACYDGSSLAAAGAFNGVLFSLAGDENAGDGALRVARTRAEDRLLLAVRRGRVRALGKLEPSNTLVEIKSSDWVGSEIDCEGTCDLVIEGWRDSRGVDRCLNRERIVRFFDVHLPREQIIAWADELESAEASKNVDDALAGDYEAFAAIEDEGQSLEGGFWSAFVACAWVGSRCERLTAAAQVYERAKLVERGGPHSASAWLVLDKVMGERFGVTITQATGRLKSAIADRQLSSGVGYDLTGRCNRDIAPAEWLGMEVLHDQHGTSLVPGIYRVSWPSADVRAAFPARKDGLRPSLVREPLQHGSPANWKSSAPPAMTLATAPPNVLAWVHAYDKAGRPLRSAYAAAEEALGPKVLRKIDVDALLKEVKAARGVPVVMGRPRKSNRRITV